MAHFPEEKVSGRIYPDSMNDHLKSAWCDIRNGVVRDQEAASRCLDVIKSNKQTISFLKDRIVANLNALDALEGIK